MTLSVKCSAKIIRFGSYRGPMLQEFDVVHKSYGIIDIFLSAVYRIAESDQILFVEDFGGSAVKINLDYAVDGNLIVQVLAYAAVCNVTEQQVVTLLCAPGRSETVKMNGNRARFVYGYIFKARFALIRPSIRLPTGTTRRVRLCRSIRCRP